MAADIPQCLQVGWRSILISSSVSFLFLYFFFSSHALLFPHFMQKCLIYFHLVLDIIGLAHFLACGNHHRVSCVTNNGIDWFTWYAFIFRAFFFFTICNVWHSVDLIPWMFLDALLNCLEIMNKIMDLLPLSLPKNTLYQKKVLTACQVYWLPCAHCKKNLTSNNPQKCSKIVVLENRSRNRGHLAWASRIRKDSIKDEDLKLWTEESKVVSSSSFKTGASYIQALRFFQCQS